MKAFFATLHQHPLPPWAWLLLPLCWGYGFGCWVRNTAYSAGLITTTRLSVPVISVGNLTTGGTGKSPVTLALAQYLIAQGKRVVILNRGYGASQPLPYGQPQGPHHGDEAWMMTEALPQAVVIVGRDRVANGQRAITEFSPDVILLDDGFQHRRLHRDLDLVLCSGHSGLGNGHLLPLGPLREPCCALKRATHVATTGETISEATGASLQKLSSATLSIPFVAAGFRQWSSTTLPATRLPAEAFAGHRVIAVSGIALPQSFLRSLLDANVTVEDHWAYPDHHVYTPEDANRIAQAAKQGFAIISTEKDRVKLLPLLTEEVRQRVFSLLIQPVLPQALLNDVDALFCPAVASVTPKETCHAG